MADSGDHRPAVRFLLGSLTLASLGITLLLVFQRWPEGPIDEAAAPQEPDYAALMSRRPPSSAPSLPALPFTDVTTAAGIDFVHRNGAAGEKLLPESLTGGGAFLDFDGDGDQDILCVNATHWPWNVPQSGTPPTSALYENDGTGQFRNVTAGSGLDVPGIYGNGIACGDYDNDGAVDVYLTALGRNHLFRNLGNGRFEDVTDRAGVAGEETAWSTSAGWLDYDRDGDLDLFVCNYLTWSADADRAMEFTLTGSVRGYGRPADFPGAWPVLYRNQDGVFQDVSQEAGIQRSDPASGQPLSKALGVTFAFVDADEWPDVIVANDTVPNQLFLNREGQRFEEAGARCGIAYDNDGSTRGAMGIDTGFFRDADALGVSIGNYANEMTALYVNQMPGADWPLFRDEAIPAGIGAVTRIALTFGTLFCDVDLNGRMDIVTCNGHLDEDIGLVQSSQQYAQPPQLLWNAGPGVRPEFVLADVADVGTEFLTPMVGRGAARADIDGDGDQDLLLWELNGPPRLLRNDQQTGNHWLRLRLRGTADNRDAVGARVLLMREDGRVLQQTVMPTCSYQSQVELPLTFGLGISASVKYLNVIWPNGQEQVVSVAGVDQLIDVTQSPQ